jgi:hypothetical protein
VRLRVRLAPLQRPPSGLVARIAAGTSRIGFIRRSSLARWAAREAESQCDVNARFTWHCPSVPSRLGRRVAPAPPDRGQPTPLVAGLHAEPFRRQCNDSLLSACRSTGRARTAGGCRSVGRRTARPSQARGSRSVNALPAPGVLSTVRSPPIPRARSRLIARPSPTPSCVRARRASTCTNGSKMRSS